MRAPVRWESFLPCARSVSFLRQTPYSCRRGGHWPSALTIPGITLRLFQQVPFSTFRRSSSDPAYAGPPSPRGKVFCRRNDTERAKGSHEYHHACARIGWRPCRSCQEYLFAQRFPYGKKPQRQKSEKNHEGCRRRLCEPKVSVNNRFHLWITPVERSVENVENCELSTGIFPFSAVDSCCGEIREAVCIICSQVGQRPCYDTGIFSPAFGKRPRKSLQIVKSRCRTPALPFSPQNFFVKNRQNLSAVPLCLPVTKKPSTMRDPHCGGQHPVKPDADKLESGSEP